MFKVDDIITHFGRSIEKNRDKELLFGGNTIAFTYHLVMLNLFGVDLFIKGESVGGCAITLELHRSGELKRLLEEAEKSAISKGEQREKK